MEFESLPSALNLRLPLCSTLGSTYEGVCFIELNGMPLQISLPWCRMLVTWTPAYESVWNGKEIIFSVISIAWAGGVFAQHPRGQFSGHDWRAGKELLSSPSINISNSESARSKKVESVSCSLGFGKSACCQHSWLFLLLLKWPQIPSWKELQEKCKALHHCDGGSL